MCMRLGPAVNSCYSSSWLASSSKAFHVSGRDDSTAHFGNDRLGKECGIITRTPGCSFLALFGPSTFHYAKSEKHVLDRHSDAESRGDS